MVLLPELCTETETCGALVGVLPCPPIGFVHSLKVYNCLESQPRNIRLGVWVGAVGQEQGACHNILFFYKEIRILRELTPHFYVSTYELSNKINTKLEFR